MGDDLNLEQGYGHGDEYDELMQENAAARGRQGEAIANTLNAMVNMPQVEFSAWEYSPLPGMITAQQVLAVLECAHAMGVVEWESWQED